MPEKLKKPQVLFFYAKWSGPCRAFRKVLDRASLLYSEFYLPTRYEEVEECKEWILSQHRVLGVPTTILLSKHEKEIARLVGYNKYDTVTSFLGRGIH
jgi:thiol-disulfide isomerase/thioredoxin